MLLLLMGFSMVLVCLKLAGVIALSWFTVLIPAMFAIFGWLLIAGITWVFMAKFDRWPL